MVSPHVFVGIDGAKAHLDIARRPTGTRWTVANDDAGIADLATPLHGLSPARSVLEAAGGLQRAVVAALAAAALPVVVVHPRQVRDCATATGQVAQTGFRVSFNFNAAKPSAPSGGVVIEGEVVRDELPDAVPAHVLTLPVMNDLAVGV